MVKPPPKEGVLRVSGTFSGGIWTLRVSLELEGKSLALDLWRFSDFAGFSGNRFLGSAGSQWSESKESIACQALKTSICSTGPKLKPLVPCYFLMFTMTPYGILSQKLGQIKRQIVFNTKSANKNIPFSMSSAEVLCQHSPDTHCGSSPSRAGSLPCSPIWAGNCWSNNGASFANQEQNIHFHQPTATFTHNIAVSQSRSCSPPFSEHSAGCIERSNSFERAYISW